MSTLALRDTTRRKLSAPRTILTDGVSPPTSSRSFCQLRPIGLPALAFLEGGVKGKPLFYDSQSRCSNLAEVSCSGLAPGQSKTGTIYGKSLETGFRRLSPLLRFGSTDHGNAQ